MEDDMHTSWNAVSVQRERVHETGFHGFLKYSVVKMMTLVQEAFWLEQCKQKLYFLNGFHGVWGPIEGSVEKKKWCVCVLGEK